MKFILFRKLVVWDDQLSVLWEGRHLHRQGITQSHEEFSFKVPDQFARHSEATDAALPYTLAAVATEFSFHLQPFTFSQGMENGPLEGPVHPSVGVREGFSYQSRESLPKSWREWSIAMKLGFNEILKFNEVCSSGSYSRWQR